MKFVLVILVSDWSLNLKCFMFYDSDWLIYLSLGSVYMMNILCVMFSISVPRFFFLQDMNNEGNALEVYGHVLFVVLIVMGMLLCACVLFCHIWYFVTHCSWLFYLTNI